MILGTALLLANRPQEALARQHRSERDTSAMIALEHAVLAAFGPARPCNRKTRRPVSDAAAAEAALLRGGQQPGAEQAGQRVVIDLAAYAALVPPAAAGGAPRTSKNTLPTKEIR